MAKRLFLIKPPKLIEGICREIVCPYHKSWMSKAECDAECRACDKIEYRIITPFDPLNNGERMMELQIVNDKKRN